MFCQCGCGERVGKGSRFRRGHHQRVQAHTARGQRKAAVRDPVLGCLLWRGAKKRDGAGVVSVAGKNRAAHRVEWERVNGPIPDGFDLRSTCGRAHCIEPRHRELKKR